MLHKRLSKNVTVLNNLKAKKETSSASLFLILCKDFDKKVYCGNIEM